MFSRRKTHVDVDSHQTETEREALLDAQSSGYQCDFQPEFKVTASQSHQAQVDQSPNGSNASTTVRFPIHRRNTRDRSPPTTRDVGWSASHGHHNYWQNDFSQSNNSHKSSTAISKVNKSRVESYDFDRSAGSYSRAIEISDLNRQQPTEFVYYNVKPGDTLQNISVRYACPVATLKRLNSIWSDLEFFGLTRIKLPVGKFGIIEDIIDAENKKSCNQTAAPTLQNSTSSATSSCLNNNVEPGDNYNDIQAHQAKRFKSSGDPDAGLSIFQNLDSVLAKAKSAALSYDDNASAIMKSLIEGGNMISVDEDINDPNVMARREADALLNDMSDYGLSYNGLILFIFIVCLVVPLVYVVYLEETHHDSNTTP